MNDNPIVFLTRTWEEAWDVYEGDERDVEGVTEADEASSLTRSVVSRAPAMTIGWLATIPTL